MKTVIRPTTSTSKRGATVKASLFMVLVTALIGVLGAVDMFAQPSVQASNIVFTRSTTSIALAWTNGNGNTAPSVGGRLVLASTSTLELVTLNSTNSLPTPDAAFGNGDILEGGFVVFAGSGNIVEVSNLLPETVYHFKVFEYSISGFTVTFNSDNVTGNPATTSTLVQEPSIAPSNLTFVPGINQLVLNWTNGDGARRIVFARQGSAVSITPTDGESYTTASTHPFNTATDLTAGNKAVFLGTANTATITGLNSEQTYHFRIVEFNGNPGSGEENYLTSPASSMLVGSRVTLAAEPTLNASGITFSNVDTDQMEISWNNTGNGGQRIVLVSTASITANLADGTTYTANSNFSAAASLPGGPRVVFRGSGSSFVLTGLSSNTIYHIAIVEFNGASGSENYRPTASSPSASRRTLAASPTVQPTLDFGARTTNSMVITWSGGNAENVLILAQAGTPPNFVPQLGTQYSTSGNFNAAIAGTISPTGPRVATGQIAIYAASSSAGQTLLEGLDPNTIYHFRIYGYNGTGESINYRTISPGENNRTTVSLAPESHPTNFNVTATTASALTLSWSISTGSPLPTRYAVVASTDATFSNVTLPSTGADISVDGDLSDGKALQVVSHPTATLQFSTGLASATTYYFRIYAINGTGEATNYKLDGEIPSTNATTLATPPGGPVTIIEAENNTKTSTSLTITWTENPATPLPQRYLVRASTTANLAGLAPQPGVEYAVNSTTVYVVAPASQVVLTDLDPGAEYTIAVFPLRGEGDGNPSYAAGVSTTATTYGTAATLVFHVEPQATVIAGVTTGTQPVVRIRDAEGLPATTIGTIELTYTTDASVTAASVTLALDGTQTEVTFPFVQVTEARIYSVTAAVVGLESTFANVTVQAAEVANYTIATIDSPQQAGVDFQITVGAYDRFNNLITTFASVDPAVVVTISETNGNIRVTSATEGTEFVGMGFTTTSTFFTESDGGVINLDVSITTATAALGLRATSAGVVSENSNVIEVEPADLGSFRITYANDAALSTETRRAGVPFDVKITALDIFGTVKTDYAEQVTVATLNAGLRNEEGDEGEFVTGTFTAGVLTTTISVTTASGFGNTLNRTITVSNGSIESTSAGFTIEPATVATFQFTGVPASVAAGANISFTVTARDAFTNPVYNFSPTTTITITSSNATIVSGGQLTGGLFNDGGGVVSHSVQIQKAGQHKISFDHTTAEDNLISVTTAVVTVNPGSLNTFRITNQENEFITETTAGITTLRVSGQDAFGNTVASFTGDVTLTSTALTTASVIIPNGNFTEGTANQAITLALAGAGRTVTATRGVQSGTTTFTVTAATVTNFVVQGATEVQAGQATTVTLIARDAFGNQNFNFVSTASITSATANLQGGTQTTPAFIAGTTTASFVSVSTGTHTIEFSTGAVIGTTTLTVTPAGFDIYTVTVASTSLQAGDNVEMTISAVDMFGNVVASVSNPVEVTSAIFGGTQVSPALVNGVTTFTVQATIATISPIFVSTAANAEGRGTSADITVGPSALDNFLVEVTPTTTTAGQTVDYTVRARDQFGNTVTTVANVEISSNTFGEIITTTLTAGITSATVTVTTAQASAAGQITASSGATTSQSNGFTVNPGELAYFTVSGATLTTPIGAQVAGTAFPITLAARDIFGNTQTEFNQTVSVTTPGGAFQSAAQLTSPVFASGLANMNVTMVLATTTTIEVQSAGSIRGTSNTFTIAPAPHVKFVVTTATNTYNAGANIEYTAFAADQFNNKVENFVNNATVEVNSPVAGLYNTAATVNFTAGEVVGTIQATVSGAGNTIRISTTGGLLGLSAEFTVNAGAADRFVVNGADFTTPVSSPQTAGSHFAISARALDEFGNVATGFTDRANVVSTNGSAVVTTGSLTPAFVAGEAQFLVRVTQVGEHAIQVETNSNAIIGTSAVFTVNPGPLNNFAISVSNADGSPFVANTTTAGQTVRITLIARDKFNNFRTTDNSAVNVTSNTFFPGVSGNLTAGIFTQDVIVTRATGSTPEPNFSQLITPQNASSPGGVAVDPNTGKLFVANNSTPPFYSTLRLRRKL